MAGISKWKHIFMIYVNHLVLVQGHYLIIKQCFIKCDAVHFGKKIALQAWNMDDEATCVFRRFSIARHNITLVQFVVIMLALSLPLGWWARCALVYLLDSAIPPTQAAL